MQRTKSQQKLIEMADRLSAMVLGLRDAVLSGRDSYEYASKIKVIACQASLADRDFWEALSQAHYDTLEIADETTCENSCDFADFAHRIAVDRSFAPFEGVRSVRRTPLPMAAE